jgi:hypothetical protein
VTQPGSHSTRSLHQDLLFLSARRAQALQLLLGVLPTAYSVLFPARTIGRSDLAKSRVSRCCPWESKPRNSDGQRSTSGYLHSLREPWPINSPSAETPMSRERATWTPLRLRGPTLPRPLRDFADRGILDSKSFATESPNVESPILRIRATCPSRNRRSRSNRGIALRGFDVHAILMLANPDFVDAR